MLGFFSDNFIILLFFVGVAGVCLWVISQVKKMERQKIQLDNAEAHIDAVDEAIKKAGKREKDISSLSLADKRKRLSK